MNNGDHEIRTPKGLRIGNRSVVDSKSENLVSVTLSQSQRQERPHFTMWTKNHW